MEEMIKEWLKNNTPKRVTDNKRWDKVVDGQTGLKKKGKKDEDK